MASDVVATTRSVRLGFTASAAGAAAGVGVSAGANTKSGLSLEGPAAQRLAVRRGSGDQRPCPSRIAAERAWAGSPSASASAIVAGARAANDSASHFTIEVRLRKS